MSFSEMDFCIAQGAQEFPPLTADAIYQVFADRDYHIHHLPVPESLVFVATLGGWGELCLRGSTFGLGAGDVLLFDASPSPFSYRCTDVGWNFWWFEFRCHTPDFLELPLETALHTPLDATQLALCGEALGRLKLQDRKTASALLAALLCLLQKKGLAQPAARRGFALFCEADAYIRRNLDTATVASTARHLGVSERTLLGLFRSLLGVRTVEYIQGLKTDMARHLLLTSGSTVGEIADFLGYADPFAFSKSFQKRFGVPPSQYRKRCKMLENRV